MKYGQIKLPALVALAALVIGVSAAAAPAGHGVRRVSRCASHYVSYYGDGTYIQIGGSGGYYRYYRGPYYGGYHGGYYGRGACGVPRYVCVPYRRPVYHCRYRSYRSVRHHRSYGHCRANDHRDRRSNPRRDGDHRDGRGDDGRRRSSGDGRGERSSRRHR